MMVGQKLDLPIDGHGATSTKWKFLCQRAEHDISLVFFLLLTAQTHSRTHYFRARLRGSSYDIADFSQFSGWFSTFDAMEEFGVGPVRRKVHSTITLFWRPFETHNRRGEVWCFIFPGSNHEQIPRRRRRCDWSVSVSEKLRSTSPCDEWKP